MKKIVIIFVILSMLVTQGVISVAAEATDTSGENSAITSGYYSVDASTAMLGSDQLVENAKAAFLYEANSETLMYAWNADVQMYPASLVKIVTALIAVEKGNLSDTVTVSESAVSSVPYNAVSADLQAGEQLTLEDLLYCMLTGSANDAAAVIAEFIGGSLNSFVDLMQQWTLNLGCTGTQFMNAHGLHDENQYTTARDVVRILDAAIDNEDFFTIFSTTNYTVDATNMSEPRELTSSNSLLDSTSRLYYDSRVLAGRTGVTEDGRRCLAAVSENNGMRLISVVMGAESVYQEDGYTAISVGGYIETSDLLDAGFDGYKTSQILYANQALKQCAVADGDSEVVLGPLSAVSTVLPEGATSADLTFRYADNLLTAPVEAGQKVSNVQVWYGGMCIAQTDLYAMNSVDVKSAEQNTDIVQENNDGWSQPLTILIVLLLGVVIAIILLRFAAKLKLLAAKYRSKRYRRSRRRSK